MLVNRLLVTLSKALCLEPGSGLALSFQVQRQPNNSSALISGFAHQGLRLAFYRHHISAVFSLQTRQHIIDGKKVEAKAAVPRNSGSGNLLTKKMFVGGTVRAMVAVSNASAPLPLLLQR